jgi:hypothetical protein
MNLVRFALNPEIKLPVGLGDDRNATARLRKSAVMSAERNIAQKIGVFLTAHLLTDAEIQVPGAVRKTLVFDLLLTDEQLARFGDKLSYRTVTVDDAVQP